MTQKEKKMVNEMVENNILEAIKSLLSDIDKPLCLINPTPYKDLNEKIRKVVDDYRNPKFKSQKQEVEEEYKQLKKFYGLIPASWDVLHTHYSHYAFCPANRKSFISEYLAWEDFVESAKKYDVAYYRGIDTFLKEYKKAVYSCLTNLD